MKITSFKKNCSKDTFLFSGSLKSVQSYYTKDNIEMIILTCYSPQGNCDILFSNYRNVFDKYVSEELLSQLAEGESIDVAYTVYTSKKTGRSFKNFSEIHFPDIEGELFEVGKEEVPEEF